MGKKGSKHWKNVERVIARYLHPDGQRNPLSGGASRHTRGDALLPYPVYVEAKHGKAAEKILRSRRLLVRLFVDTEAKARKEAKVPVVVLHPDHWPGGVPNYPAFIRASSPGTYGRFPVPGGTIVQLPLSSVKEGLPRVRVE